MTITNYYERSLIYLNFKLPLLWGSLLRLIAFIMGLVNPYLSLTGKIIVLVLVCIAGILEKDADRHPQWLSVAIAFIFGLLVSYALLPLFT